MRPEEGQQEQLLLQFSHQQLEAALNQTSFQGQFRPQLHDIYSAYQYPWMSINIFLILWLVASVTKAIYCKLSPDYIEQMEDKQRNIITYWLELIVTTVSFACQIIGGLEVFFRFEDETSFERINFLIFSLHIVSVLYVFELIYRINFCWPLLLHHLVTLFMIQLVTASINDTHDVMYVRFAILLSANATMEQTSFIALLLHRFEFFRTAKLDFMLAAIQSATIKTVAAGVSLVYYGILLGRGKLENTGWSTFWKYGYPPMLLLLFSSQLFSIRIMINLFRRNASAATLYRIAVLQQSSNKSTFDEEEGRASLLSSGTFKIRQGSEIGTLDRSIHRNNEKSISKKKPVISKLAGELSKHGKLARLRFLQNCESGQIDLNELIDTSCCSGNNASSMMNELISNLMIERPRKYNKKVTVSDTSGMRRDSFGCDETGKLSHLTRTNDDGIFIDDQDTEEESVVNQK